MSTLQQRDELLVAKIQQVSVALDNLAALQPPEHQYDEEGNDITDPAQFDLDQTAYEQAYAALRESILTSGGRDFTIGIALAGYDPATVPQAGLTACLTVTLQIATCNKWLAGIP